MKYALVTGSSSGGIGAALCRELQNKNVHVFATARTPGKVGDLQQLPNVTVIALDVTSNSSITSTLEVVKAQTGGKLDYLVNNSGSQYVTPLLDMDLVKAKEMYEVNIWGAIAMIQAFAPLLAAAKGTIVNIASISGILPAPYMAAYNGSKAAIEMISETSRLELAPLGINVITCITGVIKTNIMSNCVRPELPPTSMYAPAVAAIMARAEGKDVKNPSTPEEFARLLVSDMLSGATGRVYRGNLASTTCMVDRLMPTRMLDRMLSEGTDLEKLSMDQNP